MAATRSKTYYEILGVPSDASQDDIRQAYLRLARKYHPDKTGGDPVAEERLKEINNAYETLKKPEKRAEYDEMLRGPSPEDFARAAQGAGAGAGGGFGGFGFGGGGATGGGFDFEDILRQFAGRGGAGASAGTRRAPVRGDDVEVGIRVTLQDVANGARKTLRVPHRAVCPTCAGNGAAPGTRPETCPECGGSGRVSRSAAASFSVFQVCPRCRGTGEVIPKPCPTCGGAGEIHETQTVTVHIPAGAQTGTRLRLAGQGDTGEPGAPPGDLYVVIEVQEDPVFERDRNNVICEVAVPFTTAALGGPVTVPTLRGRASLRIPAGTQSGQTLRMRGQGLPRMNGGDVGDQLVRVRIQVPTKLSDEARDLMQRLDRILDPSAYAQETGRGGSAKTGRG